MDLPIPQEVVYAGLAGVVLALIVATATNKWRLKVFFLLALRLAIGWHFFFEGAHKIHSHMVGVTETNKPFSSEPYFTVAEGPFGDVMRKKALGDVDQILFDKLAPNSDKIAGFAKLSDAEQAALCPKPVAELLEKAAAAAPTTLADDLKAATAEWETLKGKNDVAKLKAAETAADAATAAPAKVVAEKQAALEVAKARVTVLTADAKPELGAAAAAAKQADKALADARAELLKAKAAAEKATKDWADGKKKVDAAKAKIDSLQLQIDSGKNNAELQKAAYARWVYGVDRRDAKAKYFGSDVPQSAAERFGHIAKLNEYYEGLKARQGEHLGNGYGNELKRTAAAKADVRQAKADLLADADSFVADLAKTTGGKLPDPFEKPIVQMDKLTMWTITSVGALLLLGLFTRLAAVVGAGFLILTYLSHPTVPWLPLPPGTEGNPLFINKNLIEALAMLVVVVHPTGRWLGLDALLWRLIFGDKPALYTKLAA